MKKATLYMLAMSMLLLGAARAEQGEAALVSANPQTPAATRAEGYESETILWQDDWAFAEYSKTHRESYSKYLAKENRLNKTVFLNPGHGDGTTLSTKVLSDPLGAHYNQYAGADGMTSGHTSGMNASYQGGVVKEAEWNLEICKRVREKLLAGGCDVILAREENENSIDNPGRAIVANQTADIHVSIHFNSGRGGGFYIVPSNPKQENVALWYAENKALGAAIAEEYFAVNPLIRRSADIAEALSGYNYSTIPCVYFESFGAENEKYLDYAVNHMDNIAEGYARGILAYLSGE